MTIIRPSAGDSIDSWPARLERVIADGRHFKRLTVLRETDSTQDAARRMNAVPGSVIVTGRQTAGRGRLGRTWVDEAGEGLAVTMVIGQGEPERLAMATAVGAARAAEAVLNAAVGIKWPNDIVVDGRKLAGIIIEQADRLAIIGVGMNVLQQSWPAEIATRAVSLRQLGSEMERVEVLATLIGAMDSALGESIEVLAREFTARDALRGTTARLKHDGRIYGGVIRQVDPLRGLRIQCADREYWLPAATTSVEPHCSDTAGRSPR